MSKKVKTILSVLTAILVLPFAIWGVSILRCEILTNSCGDEFAEGYKQCNMIGDIEYFKVIDYYDFSASVYYVSEDFRSGNVFEFVKENEEWKMKNWKTVWSESGSADGFLWPYITDSLIHSYKIFEKKP